uniref:B30.2/SPRY domain-containing protein n=1 Tax=Noctiluca scintillans TaxID=2966 RepID=A0A7S1F2S2_NOCSC
METVVPTLELDCVVSVVNLAGVTVVALSPIPARVHKVKETIEEQTGVPCGLQVLLLGTRALRNEEPLGSDGRFELVLVVDESPMWHWDVDGNPGRLHLVGDAGHLTAPLLGTDYVNVVTQEPLRDGVHFFEFVVHRLCDEQWCGIVDGNEQAGVCGIPFGCFYYFNARGVGQRRSNGDDWEGVRPVTDGDVIGMALDMDSHRVAFAVNGELEFVTDVPGHGPIYCMTTVDEPEDHIELRKPPVCEAPPPLIHGLRADA